MGAIIFLLLMLYCGTCAFEGIPLALMRKREEWLKASLICNAITNPILNTLLMILIHFVEDQTILLSITICLEVIVVVVEAYFYKRMLRESMLKCLVVSLIANAISFLLGILFYQVFYIEPKSSLQMEAL